jgi:hypothetical protein
VAEAKAVADAEDTEEDDESGEDDLQLWPDAPVTVEHTPEAALRTIEQNDRGDDLDKLESDEDSPEAHNSDLAPLPTTNISN